jgi:signal transduction histidine kinase
MNYLEETPVRSPLDLGALLSRIIDDAQPQADAAGIRLIAEASPAPVTVRGDSHLLTRAIENLLDNALRHTPEGGTVRVTWQEAGREVRISVIDSGPGIAVEDLPHLFEPLYRGESSRNRETGGAGLGLTIARRIIETHGGTLSASNAPSGGAVFTATLPKTE